MDTIKELDKLIEAHYSEEIDSRDEWLREVIDLKDRFAKNNEVLDLVSQRYFIVSYIANVVRGSMTGNLDVVTNGEYLNRVLTTENIRESIKQDCSDIVITNIIL